MPTIEPLMLKDLFSIESPERDAITEYSLRAIIDHHGTSGGGHYTAQCKDKLSNVWYVYDDENTGITPAPMIGESTYVLFWERV